MLHRTFIVALPLLVSSGCGAIFTPSSALVTLTSEPDGAEVRVDGFPVGRTPLQTYVSNRRHHHVTFEYGGQETGCILEASVGAGWVVLDVLLGLIPVVIDAATGGWTTLNDGGCHAQFGDAQVTPDETPVSSL